MATIVKCEGARGTTYKVRYRNPEGATRSKAFKTHPEAKTFATTVEGNKHGGTFVEQSHAKTTFGEWFAQWWPTTVGLRNSTRDTLDAYTRSHLLPQWGAIPMGRIDPVDVQAWVANLAAPTAEGGKGLAPATVNKQLQIFRGVLDAAVAMRRLPYNPLASVKGVANDRTRDRYLTVDEVELLASTIDKRYRAMVIVGAYCGLRFGEMVGLTVGDIDLVRRRVNVARTVVEVKGVHHTHAPKTKAGRRSVPFGRAVAAEIEAHLDAYVGRDPAALVFPSPKGGMIRASLWRRRVWHPAVVKCELAPLVPHELRHTAVTWWIACDATLEELKAWAGHSRVQSLIDRYGHLMVRDDDSVTDKLDAWAAAAKVPAADVVPLRAVG
jgi:integrase